MEKSEDPAGRGPHIGYSRRYFFSLRMAKNDLPARGRLT